ncbi:MAG TPA: hypothetical protein VEY70_17040 [Metabacillus sp.]|nr:hypothetical protein [Metabacillus sp.]
MFGKRKKINTLFWIAIFGLILTTIYSAILVYQGIDSKRKLNFIYRKNKEEAES